MKNENYTNTLPSWLFPMEGCFPFISICTILFRVATSYACDSYKLFKLSISIAIDASLAVGALETDLCPKL